MFHFADSYEPGTFQAVQLEDGSTAYIHHPVIVAPGSTVLEVQTESGLEELAKEEEEYSFDVDTINALQQYGRKVRPQHLLAWVCALPSAVLVCI